LPFAGHGRTQGFRRQLRLLLLGLRGAFLGASGGGLGHMKVVLPRGLPGRIGGAAVIRVVTGDHHRADVPMAALFGSKSLGPFPGA